MKLSMEIKHKGIFNKMETQNIEELRRDIEKVKNMKFNIISDIDELELRMDRIQTEKKLNEINYKVQKNDLEDKLKSVKQEIQSEKSNGRAHAAEFKKASIFI